MSQTQLPASFAGVLAMSQAEQMNLGVPTPALDGSSAFTLSGWFQVPATTETVVVLSQENAFSFFFSGQMPGVTLGQHRLSPQLTLKAGRFHQLAAVYTPPGANGGGQLQFYVDGAPAASVQVSTAPSGSGSTASLIAGDAQHPVTLRRLWLTATALTPEEMIHTRFGTTGTALTSVQSTWDWGQIPAVIIGAPEPVAIGSASPSVTTPGLTLNGTATAKANLPTGTSFAQGTLQGWFWFPASVSSAQVGKLETLFQMGTSGAQIALSATPSSNGKWSLQVTLGNVSFTAKLKLSGWHNLAVTWNSNKSGVLYVDGQHNKQHGKGPTSGVSASTVSIGNAPSGGQAFSGTIQNVVLWSTMLTAQSVNAQMKPWFPITNVNPVAFYDFTQDPPIDVVSGAQLTLQGNASIEYRLWTAANVAPSMQMLVAVPQPEPLLYALRPQRPPKPSPALFTPQKEAALLQALQGHLAKGAKDPRLEAQGAALVAKLKEQFARGRAGNPDLTGLVHTEQQGDEWITFYYDKEGPRAILRRSTAEVAANPCSNWVVDFVATALFGLLDIMGIPVSMGVGVKAIQKLLGKSAIWEAVSEVLEASITEQTIIGLLQAINDGGGMTAFVDAVLDNMSWWDFAWMVAEVLIELIGLLVPGLEETIVLAKCVLLVARLEVKAEERPAGCPQ
jgi:hypothetical protein